ncbi:Uncharacterized protein Fot_56449 [Forsythia ovata]|uniref:Uncharacterized protein n=1 Tax=Forsythia ovata TaxID=205694 RepID=A0ABD1NZJ3_9LAMI
MGKKGENQNGLVSGRFLTRMAPASSQDFVLAGTPGQSLMDRQLLALTRDDREKSRLVQRRPASTPLGWAACLTSFPRLYSLLAYPGPLRESSWFGSSVIALTEC